jgi:hypothetical protein
LKQNNQTKMPPVSWIATIISLFLVFIVGLNLGLHGIISIHGTQQQPKTQSDTKLYEDSSLTNIERTPVIQEQRPQSVESTVILNLPIINEGKSTPVAKSSTESIFKLVDKEQQLKYHEKVMNREETLSVQFQKMEESLLKNSKTPIDISSSLKTKYQHTPIVLLTCNRPALLRETLTSLLKVQGVLKDQILIVQDGNMQEVATVVKESNLALLQNLSGLRLRGGAGSDGASRIAQHYKYALSAAFDRFPQASALIIVEDDLLFAPDFYYYLTAMAPIIDLDPSTFVISAWNDNGFKGKVHDLYAIRRTEFFPGLGWILSRRLYKQELEPKWPREHWDHWLRSPETHQNRECIYPQVK